MADVTLGNEVFTDLDFADDVALLTEMLHGSACSCYYNRPNVGRGGGLWSSDKLVENQNTPGSPIHALLNSPGGRWTC